MNCFLWQEGDFDHVMGRDGIMGVRDFLPREWRGGNEPKNGENSQVLRKVTMFHRLQIA